MKYAIFENLSTTTKIESLPFLDLGKHKIKSIEILTQGALGTGKGVHNSCGKTLDLAYLQVMQRSVLLSLFIFGQKKNVHVTLLKSSLHQNDPLNHLHVLHAQLTHRTIRHTKSILYKQVPI